MYLFKHCSRVICFLFLAAVMSGCATTAVPDHFQYASTERLAPNATFWVERCDTTVTGESEHFMAPNKAAEMIEAVLNLRLLTTKRLAPSREAADYLVSVDADYQRLIQSAEDGMMASLVLGQSAYMGAARVGYTVSVRPAADGSATLLHIRQPLATLQPSNNWHTMRNAASLLTREANTHTENGFIDWLASSIAADLSSAATGKKPRRR